MPGDSLNLPKSTVEPPHSGGNWKLATMSSKPRSFASHLQQPLFCTRTQQIGALFLVATTFFLTRFLDRTFFAPCESLAGFLASGDRAYLSHGGDLSFDSGHLISWPERGFGFRLDLKIYVYDENEIDGLRSLMYGREGKIAADECAKGQWGTQVKIHRLLLESKFQTVKKEEADLFFVPTYVKCVRMTGGLTDKEINQAYIKVLSQMPYFRLSGGRDHIFVFPSGAGAHFFKSWATYINRSIILTLEGDCTDKRDTSAFNTWKDIIIPGNVDDGMTGRATFVQPLPLTKRKYLANYLGRAQGKTGRLKLIELAKQYPDKDVIDYTQISIKLPSSWIGPELLEYLESIPDDEVKKMIARGRQVRCLFVYASESQPCSAISGIFWELQRKVRHFHQSAEIFWLHNRTIVNRNLVPFSDWRPPMPLP